MKRTELPQETATQASRSTADQGWLVNWIIIRRTLYTGVAIVLALAGAACIALHTRAFNRFLLSEIIQQAGKKTGARVEIQRLAIDWTRLEADLYGVTLYGQARDSDFPLFQAAHLKVGLEFAPLLSGHMQIAEIALDRPVVHFMVNEQGQTNLPRRWDAGKAPAPASPAELFDLAIRHVVIRSGRLYYNDSQMPLSGELDDFGMRVNFEKQTNRYQGVLHYANGHIAFKNLRPIDESAQVRFSAGPTGATISPFIVTTAGSQIRLRAELKNYADPTATGRYEAIVSTAEIGRLTGRSGMATGGIASGGTFRYRHVRGRSLFDSLQVDGTLHSARLALHLTRFRADATALRASFSLNGGELRIASLKGELLGGQLRMKPSVLRFTGQARSQISAMLRNIPLRDASEALPRTDGRRFSLAGRADLAADVSWAPQFRQVILAARATIRTGAQARLAGGEIPVNGFVQIRYDQARDEAALGNSHLAIGPTQLSASGILSRHSSLQLTLIASNLQELSALVTDFEDAEAMAAGPHSRFPQLNGSARFDGHLSGSPGSITLQGRISGRNVRVDSTQWRSIGTELILSASRVALTNGVLTANRQSRILFAASAGLQDWSLVRSSPVSIHAAIAQIPVSGLERLAGAKYPVSGTVSAEMAIQGTLPRLSGSGSAQIVNVVAWGQRVERVTLKFQGRNGSVEAKAALQSAAGAITANLTYALPTTGYELAVRASGVKLGALHFLRAHHLAVSGTLSASASGNGTLSNPQLSATFAIPKLEAQGQQISDARGKMRLSGTQLDFAVNGKADSGTLQAQADVALTGAHQVAATLDLRSLPMGDLLAAYTKRSLPALKGEADLEAELRGPLKDPSRLELHAEIQQMWLGYRSARAALLRPLRLDYQNGVATIQPAELKGTGIDLMVQGAIPVKGTAPLRVTANGTLNLGLFHAMTPGIQSSGRVVVQLMAQGRPAQPTMQGSARIESVSLSNSSIPVDLSRVNGQIDFSGNRIELTRLGGDVGGGTMSAQGAVILGTQPRFDLAVNANSVSLNYPAGLITRLNCDLHLIGTPADSALSGRVVLDYLGFTQNFDMVSLASQFSSNAAPATASPLDKHMRLNIAVQSASTLSLASSQLSLQGAANLNVRGTLASPVVLGRATLAGGELFFSGKRYTIQSGTIEFANPVRTTPVVDLYANTTVNQYNISLHFFGPVDRMKTSFTSSPALPPADIVSLIAFGETSEQRATATATPAALGAEAVLAQAAASQVSGTIQKLAGISQLSITPVIGNSAQNPGAQIAIQQRLSGRLLVTFTTNTAETQSTAVQIQYQLGRGLSVSALRDQNGGYGIDVHVHKAF